MNVDLSPYPSVYCPGGVAKPAHCVHVNRIEILPGKAPDGGAGVVYGARYDESSKPLWQKTSLGWWVLLAGRRPQELPRLDLSPRIVRWHSVAGAGPDQYWRVPVLLTPADPADPTNEAKGWVTAIDRVLTAAGWSVPPEIGSIQERLLSITQAIALDDDLDKRNQAVTKLVIEILALGHQVSMGEIEAGGWLSELMQSRVIFAAIDRMDLCEKLDEVVHAD